MDPVSWIMVGTSVIGGIASHSQQKKAAEVSREEKIRAYEYNIERIKQETAGTVGDIKRSGREFGIHQTAAMGASGAELGIGTPLMNMLETEASIARDIARVKKAAALETEYYQEEIEALGGGKKKTTIPSYSGGINVSPRKLGTPARRKTKTYKKLGT